MSNKSISANKIFKIFEFYALNGLNKTQIAKVLNISRGTVYKYVNYYEQSEFTYADLFIHQDKIIADIKSQARIIFNTHKKLERLMMFFPIVHNRLILGGTTLKKLWAEYLQNEPYGYKYSQFVHNYHKWQETNNLNVINLKKWKIEIIEVDDLLLLKKWKHSNNRSKWEKSVALLDLYKGKSILGACPRIGDLLQTP